MLTYAFIQLSAATGWHSSMRCGYQVIETHPATHRCPIYTIPYLRPRTNMYYIRTTVCPCTTHTTIYVSSYYFICVLTLRYVCPHALCLPPHVSRLMPHVSCLRWYTCGVNDFMSSFAGMHQEEFLARMVLSLLALLVQRYKY